MDIRHTILGELPMVYAVAVVPMDDGIHFLAATELYGRWMHFRPPDYRASIAREGPGGVMSIVPLKGRGGEVVAIERAYPIYNGVDTRITLVSPPKGGATLWEMEEIAAIPFLHRIGIISDGGPVAVLLAATMTGGKAHQDDWSQQGRIYAGAVPERGSPLVLSPILHGISRNHGMHVVRTHATQEVLVSGIEGLFSFARAGGNWSSLRLLDHDVSDAAVFDLDGDGRDEVITIEPFHGNRYVIYRNSATGLRREVEIDGAFAHVVWAGFLRGQRCLVLGDRAARKELRLLTFRGDGTLDYETRVLDAGGGPANISVAHLGDRDLILCANHVRGEISLFELT
jgi:hypothetical protein